MARKRVTRASLSQQKDFADDHDDAEPLFSISLPEDVDLEALNELLPDTDWASPTAEGIASIYKFLLSQVAESEAAQRELDELRANAERKDVELDQALQDREQTSTVLESQIETLQTELKGVKAERDALLASQSDLQAQIRALSSSHTSSSTEVDDLKHRLQDVEREKRDLVGVISRLKEESSQREEEITTLRGNLREARQEHQTLEAQVRELKSSETSSKFKVDTLTQQLQLSQGEVERVNSELTTKSEQFTKYRREKQAELVSLQAQFDQASQAQSSAQASLKALQATHAAQTQSLTQALTKNQDLSGQLAEQESTYLSEANTLRRLVAVMEDREKGLKEMVENFEKDWAGVSDKAEHRENILKEEIAREKQRREETEQKLERLEVVFDKMDKGELPMPGTPGSRRVVDESMDGMFGLSPTIAIASRAQKSGKTFTEVYADYVKLQQDFAQKSAEYDHMDRTLAAVLAQIEERAPILSQQRVEYERLQQESSQLASQLSQAITDRDAQATVAQDNAQKLVKSVKENSLLQQQLEDLGRQVQYLLKEIGRRDDPGLPSDAELEASEIVPILANDVGTVITNNLVLFRSISGLQEQNQKLLRITRDLAQKMETEERDYKHTLELEQGEAVREAHEMIQELAAKLETQKKHSETMIQAYAKERDTYKALLARATEQAQANGAQIDSTVSSQLVGPGAASASPEARQLAEIQSEFDAYRTETDTDSLKLREELSASQRETRAVTTALSKAQARIEFLQERQVIHQEQFTIHTHELDALTKRNQQLYDQWTRTDIELGRVSDELQISTGHLEQLRNECANLRAEKKIWEGVQGRLVDENKTLALERSHLSDLMGNVQKMHNDLERSGENDRRRLENQLQSLDNQTQDLRAQLSQERDNIRHLTLQKDIELRELQNRIEKSAQELSKTRESLVGAETSKKHLEERILDLTKQLQGNEEKLSVYERRPALSGTTVTTIGDADSQAELAELRSSLKVAELDLAAARRHVQQFQDISQANETALSRLTASHDEYKASTEAELARKQSDYTAVQERLELALQESSQATTKLDELRRQVETDRATWLADKKILEDTLADLNASEKFSESDRTSRENEVRNLEQQTKDADQRYKQEVVAHAESIKRMDHLKEQLDALRTSSQQNTNAAKTAEAKLSASEESWKQQKDTLEKEISNLNTRCRELTSQNSTLHNHLESITSQATRIRDVTAAPGIDMESAGDNDPQTGELRSVVAYLRKEKEIVDLQLELSKQENSRLKTQVDHLTQNLESTRAALSEERERALETAASAAQHQDLMERINQYNLLRESNAKLRADCEAYSKKTRALEAKVKELSSQLEPIQEQVRIAQAEVDTKNAQVQRLEDESRRWQERNSQLLSKYDRIDPAEVQALKDEIETLKTFKTEQEQALQQTIADQTERIKKLETTAANYKEVGIKNNNRFRERMAATDAEKTLLAEKQKELEAQISNLSAALVEKEAALTEAQKLAPAAESSAVTSPELDSLRAERDQLLIEKATWASPIPSAEVTTPEEWEVEKAKILAEREEALTQAKGASEKVLALDQDVKNKTVLYDKLRARAQALMAELDKFKKAAAAAPMSSSGTSEDAAKHAEELKSLQTKLGAEHAEQLKAQEARLSAEHAEKLKDARSVPTAGADSDQSATVAAALAEQQKTFDAKLLEEVNAAVERGRLESQAKVRLKDQQILRTQNKLKETEKLLEAARNGTVLPTMGAATSPNPPPATAALGAPTTTTSPVASISTTAPPSKAPGATTAAATPATGAGRGRGGPGAALRGAVRGAAGRGRGTGSTPTTAPGGMSIHGAAAKRPREEGDTGGDSLVKRMKPAEGTVPATQATKAPVQIKRPAPGPAS